MEHLTFDELLKYAKRTVKETRDEQGKLKPEYKSLIDKINNHIHSCPECSNLIIKLQETKSIEEIAKLKSEFEHKKEDNKLTEEEKICKQYGIRLDSIEHIKLNDGKEYYHFYDIRLNKDVIIKQGKNDRNMSEEFKEVQDSVSLAQGKDEVSNGEEVFRHQRLHTNNEVKLYNIEELISNPEIIGTITKEQMKAVSVLLKNKEKLRIKQINPETGIAVDDTHKIITSYYNDKTQQYEVSTPNQYEYNTESVSVNETEQLSQNINETESIEISDDLPHEIDGVIIDQSRVKLYYEYPEMLDRVNMISQQEKEAYIKAIEKYKLILENKKSSNSKDHPKVLVKKDDTKKTSSQEGFASLLLLSLITGFAGGVMTAIMYTMIK